MANKSVNQTLNTTSSVEGWQSLWQLYNTVAPQQSAWDYTQSALHFIAFWVVVQYLNHLIMLRINSVYRNKNAADRADYLSYTTSLIHGPLSATNAVYCTLYIW